MHNYILYHTVVIDTPRALIAHGKRERGLKNLCKLRGLTPEHPYLKQEYMEICVQVDAEQELKKGKFNMKNCRSLVSTVATVLTAVHRFKLLDCDQRHHLCSQQHATLFPRNHSIFIPQVHRN